MFERFTTRARSAVVHAQDEARELGHAHIDLEHLLLGLLSEPESIAAIALRRCGVTAARTRAEVVAAVGRGDTAPPGHIPFTPGAKRVLELALREALTLGHNYIGTEHVLLAIVAAGPSAALTAIAAQGTDGDAVRREVRAEIGHATAARSGKPAPAPARTPAAEAVLAAAQELAGDAPMGSHHLLEAMALVDDSLAASTLAALGIAGADVAATIDELGIAGTSDVTPELEAVQHLEVHLDDDAVRIVLADPATRELVARLVDAMGNPIRGSDPAGATLIGLWQAVRDALTQVVGRVEPATPADDTGRSARVRAALRSRLLRRRGRSGTDPA